MKYNEKFLALVEAIKKVPTKYPQLRVACLAQAIMECGRCNTKLALEHNNFWGMKIRPEIEDLADAVYYETDTEPSGGDHFAKFKNPEDAVTAYWRFLNRSPYKGYEAHTATPEEFLKFIGWIWCQPDDKADWIRKHDNMEYWEYIVKKLMPEAKELLKDVHTEPKPEFQVTVTVDKRVETFTKEHFLGSYLGIKLDEGYTQIALSKPVQDPELKRGDKGDRVTRLQKELNEHFDAQLTVDGDFGPKTEEAVKKVEAHFGLPVNGTADFDLWRMIETIKDGKIEKDITPEDVQPPVDEPLDNDSEVGLWIPFAKKHPRAMKGAGTFRKYYPEFLLVHYSAGRDGTGTIDYGIKHGYNFLLITRDGQLHQACPLNKWGYHAGQSYKEGYGDSVSEYCVGVEISTAGTVDEVIVNGEKRYKAYFHTKESEYFRADEVRWNPGTPEKINKGWYHKYTPAQEATLVKLLAWLEVNNKSVFKIEDTCGHENVATPKGRKPDPGGALSMTMAELIKKAKALAGIREYYS